MSTRRKKRTYSFVAYGYLGGKVTPEEHAEQNCKLGTLYISVTRFLISRTKQNDENDNRWGRRKNTANVFNLFLGGACGDGIPFKRLSASGAPTSTHPTHQRLLNFYRGFQIICRKSFLVDTMRAYFETIQKPMPDFLPRSFLFYPAKPERSERAQFKMAFEDREKKLGPKNNLWILKPSDGSKGRNIIVLDNVDDIINHVDDQKAGSIAWVVQEYIINPLLLTGDRKFDIRCWILLDSNYNAWMYKEGVLRTTSVAFSLDKESLSNRFVHLSNHCIQTEHEDYGKFEPTNEMFFKEFKEYLHTKFNVSLDDKIIPQIKDIVQTTLIAAKDQLQTLDGSPYKSFNVFGYDFMIDTNMKVHLIEINSSPAVAADLLPKFTKSLVEKAIDPVFPIIPQKNSSSSSDENNFEQQFQSLKMLSEGGGDVAKTNKMIDDGFEFICFK